METWANEAACRDADPEIFFPEKGGTPRAAKQVCARCPVSVECLEYALGNGLDYGVWGGVSMHDRGLKRIGR
jgi:WhiB family transcriptional regulator, redox-sensing transcriptional regulator